MFENILSQNSTDLLSKDITNHLLPGSILFSGPSSSAKLSCALETARVVSCKKNGNWLCDCPSCQKHKALVSDNVMLCGPSNRILDIKAAASTLLTQNYNNTSHLEASRFLFIRAVRKLTMRFSPVLWEGEDKLSKFSPLLQSINEALEELDPGRTLPEGDALKETIDSIVEDCAKLEKSFLYSSLPVNQIRNLSSWAHLSAAGGKKVIIIENADRMADSARNALLKILEEPPADVLFILLTSNRGAMLPTILSRVRNYSFVNRTVLQQQEVIDKVFHFMPTASKPMPESIEGLLQYYLSTDPSVIKDEAGVFLSHISEGRIPDIPAVCSACGNFDPDLILKVFIERLTELLSPLRTIPSGCEALAQIYEELRTAYTRVSVYNQNPAACLEELSRNLLQVNHEHNSILSVLNK